MAYELREIDPAEGSYIADAKAYWYTKYSSKPAVDAVIDPILTNFTNDYLVNINTLKVAKPIFNLSKGYIAFKEPFPALPGDARSITEVEGKQFTISIAEDLKQRLPYWGYNIPDVEDLLVDPINPIDPVQTTQDYDDLIDFLTVAEGHNSFVNEYPETVNTAMENKLDYLNWGDDITILTVEFNIKEYLLQDMNGQEVLDQFGWVIAGLNS
jgi:hypothetical protein